MSTLAMPKLSDTMEEGTVLRWLQPDGAEVVKGDPLVEIETDKATMTVPSPESGRLAVMAQEGDSLPVGAPIATIGTAGAGPPPGPDPAEPVGGIPVADDGTGGEIDMDLPAGDAHPGAQAAAVEPLPDPADRLEPPPPMRAAEAPSGGGRVKASPLARTLAARLGVDLSGVRGSGPDGRIVKADVEAASRGGAAPPPPPVPAAPPAPVAADGAGIRPPADAAPAAGERRPLSRLQRTVARRMVQSVREAPHFTLQRDVDATALLALRSDLAAVLDEGRRPSLNDLVVRALALAAAERPEAVGRIEGDDLLVPSSIDVGLAVAVEGGLMVPVVRAAHRLAVADLAVRTRDLAARCRDGTITPAELEGGVVTVSNLGMYGVDRFAAIINPPQAAILAVGRVRPTPVARDGQVVVRDVMTITLSVDHRVLYGAEGAQLVGRVSDLLERPAALLV